ncbi:MAG: methylated-DNA--protein-cysteine methyltransferase [Microbacterium sp.]|uniref:methylated-DNA--[protein]-cysteine S-methyltransferase n=1 Tax=unclassified Microbacterium TaxID=2609290 RepID=UPI000DB8D180|nr:methylated-DNA--[protein]-cysteine S-methyltransferase [Microbacterium sp.]PZU40671.1 MAG: methylated-DNA--protein-cysteine methyltransferase [Microbacterium sp.]
MTGTRTPSAPTALAAHAAPAALVETIATPDGAFTIIAAEDGSVLASGWTADPAALTARIHPSLRPTELRAGPTPAAEAARSYYAGEIAAIDGVVVRQRGTDLQERGWSALRRIDPGAPLTYTSFAAAFGSPAAVRAAASVCARNAPALFVPCHRVLRADGTLGGFAWGLDVKRSLLAREAAR